MEFVGIEKVIDSYVVFNFESHNPDFVCVGDQVWSDGVQVMVHECVDDDVLSDLISQVNNKQAFRGALIRMELL